MGNINSIFLIKNLGTETFFAAMTAQALFAVILFAFTKNPITKNNT